MDEGTIYGELSELEAIFLRLLRELPLIGLYMNPSKCILVTSASSVDGQFSHIQMVDPTKILGVPFGGDNYVRRILNETVEKVNFYCDRVEELEHPQIGVLLLRKLTPCQFYTICLNSQSTRPIVVIKSAQQQAPLPEYNFSLQTLES